MDRPAALELYEKLVATNPTVERKGDTMPYTSVNGHKPKPTKKKKSATQK